MPAIAPLAVTVSNADVDVALKLATLSELGATDALTPAGAPATWRFTSPLKALRDETKINEVAEPVAGTVRSADAVASEKSVI